MDMYICALIIYNKMGYLFHMQNTLDLYDKKILSELDVNSRISASQLAAKIKLPKESVNYRIKRLIKENTLRQFYALVNGSLFGQEYYMVYLKLHKYTPEEENRILSYLLEKSNCFFIRLMEGEHHISFMTCHYSPKNFRQFMYSLGQVLGDNLLHRTIHIITRLQKHNQKLLVPHDTKRIMLSHDILNKASLDKDDVDILNKLTVNARSRLTALSEELKMDPKAIRYRIKKMEKSGIIAGYSSLIDLERFGYDFLKIDFVLKDPAKASQVTEFLDSTNSLVFSYEMLGRFDLSAEIYVRGDEQLRTILAEMRQRFMNDYIACNVSRIFRNFVTSSGPYELNTMEVPKARRQTYKQRMPGIASEEALMISA
jgi:Lrp/AsnC family transcriptional regulator, leucine-responsive regulatory protein